MQPRHVVVLNWKDTEHPEAGGAEVYCSNVAAELVRTGAEVTYVTSRPRGQAARTSHQGYSVRRMGGTLTVYPLALVWLLLHRRRVDAVIDSQNGIPFFSPLVVGRRVAVALLIHHVHQDQFALYFSPFMAKVGRWLESSASRIVYGTRAVCAVSPSTRTDIRRRLKLDGPIFVTPNGYRSSGEITPRRAAVPTITCVGRLAPHKRWHLLVDAVGDLAARGIIVRLELIGSGSEAERLQRRITELGLDDRVVLHGFVSNEERDTLLAKAWLTACSSVAEGWGLSVIEAAAQGVPAVALDVPGLRDSVLDGVTGWLTEEDGLADAIAAAITRLAEPATRDEYADSCRRWAGSLRWSSTADRFRAVLAAEMIRAHDTTQRRGAQSDSAVMLTLDRAAARRIDPHALGTTDQVNFCATCLDDVDGPLRVVLSGADEIDAFELIAEYGIDPVADGVDVRLCRSSDRIQWHAGGVPHNAPSLLTFTTCPATERDQRLIEAQRRIA